VEDLFTLSRQFLIVFDRPYERYFLQKNTLENRFSIIIGPRGVGKTTAIIQFLLSKYKKDFSTKKAIYIPVDHVVVAKRRLYDIAEDFYNLGGELICFDEIHKYANWSGEFKSIYDSFPKLRIVASGSSAMQIRQGSHDISRRAVVYRMTGLSLREYIDLTLHQKTKPFTLATVLKGHEKLASQIVGSIEKKNHKVLALFKDYLKQGYFPYFQEFTNVSQYYITLEQSIHTTIESDLLSIHGNLTGSSIKKLKKLLAVIAESVPFTPDMKRLKKIIDIGDERTLKIYLQYLEEGGIVFSLFKAGSRLKSLEKPEKIYLNNPNQIYALSGEGKENLGNIRETYFINMLSVSHELSAPKQGDFLVNRRYTFEVGGKNKDTDQVRHIHNAYLAIDDIEVGIGKKIPLWLFGFLY